jgi:TIR domain
MVNDQVTDVFISYRRGDAAYAATRIQQQLQRALPHLSIFIDREMPGGEAWAQRLDQALAQCRIVVVLIGSDFVSEFERRAAIPDETDYMRRELETAIDLKKWLVPVVLGSGDMPARQRLPEKLQALTGAQAVFAPATSFSAAMDSLATALVRRLGVDPDQQAQADDGRALLRRWADVLQWAVLWMLQAGLAGQVLAWRCADLGPWPAVRQAWTGAQFVLATALLGLTPYLLYWLVSEVRVRAGLPPLNRQGAIGMLGVMVMLLAGCGFLLLSTVRRWELNPLLPQALFPERGAGPVRYVLLAVTLMAIAAAALALALWEPRLRAATAERRERDLRRFDLLCALWLLGTLALFCDGPLRWIASGQ